MANQTHISDILDKPATQIDRPKPLPVGEYVWTVIGLPRHDKSKEKQTPFVEFKVRCLSALESVDEDALNEWASKSDGTMRDLKEFEQKLTFYTTPDSLYRLQDFLVHLGVADDEKTTRQCLDDTPNCQFVGSITHSASKDGESIYANIGKTAPVED
jgi:hypothetical protein